MNIFILLILILYAVIGGLSTLALIIGIPATLIWKIYRTGKYRIRITD